MKKKLKADMRTELTELRCFKVVKSNEIIQKSRFDLHVQEQKIILYLISKIKPEDMELKEHIFEIQDFCQICGLDSINGANYIYIKKTLKGLRDKSIWITLDSGSETTLAWIDYVTMHPNSGKIMIKINDMMKPYLLQLKNHFTQYELLYILAMKSQYSLRLYELLKSYEYQEKKIFDIDELKKRLSAEKYRLFADFNKRVLSIALREVNALSDITVTYEIIKESRKFAKIAFLIKLKTDTKERLITWAKIDKVIAPDEETWYERVYNEKPDV